MENNTFKGKLSLKKETITMLNNEQMGLVKGGGIPTLPPFTTVATVTVKTVGSDNLCTSGSCGTLTISKC